jgi:2-methylcitrate dehydratase
MLVDQVTDAIVEFEAQLRGVSLPDTTKHEVKRRLLDSLACGIGGMSGEPANITRLIADAAPTSSTGATVLGSRSKTSPELAAFANTVMVRYLDYNDTYFSPGGGGGHPSDLIPTALALGESTGSDGESVMRAIALAYEVWGGLAGAVRIRERGWDQGAFTVVASAVCAGHLLRLTRGQMANAVSLAICPNIPVRRTRAGALSMWKGCATAGASRNGVFAATLASLGMTGPPQPFSGEHGIFDQVTGPFELDLPEPAPGGYLIENSHLKSRPAEYNAQGPLDIIDQVRSEFALDRIEAIDIETYWLTWSEIGHEAEKWDPRTRETADHSLPYLVAVSLVDGGLNAMSFTPQRIADPMLRPLMQRIRIIEHEEFTTAFPREIKCRMTFRLRDGAVIVREIDHPFGHARNPMDDARLEQKYTELIAGRDGRDAEICGRLREDVWGFDRAEDVTSILAPLADLSSDIDTPDGLAHVSL